MNKYCPNCMKKMATININYGSINYGTVSEPRSKYMNFNEFSSYEERQDYCTYYECKKCKLQYEIEEDDLSEITNKYWSFIDQINSRVYKNCLVYSTLDHFLYNKIKIYEYDQSNYDKCGSLISIIDDIKCEKVKDFLKFLKLKNFW